MPDSSRTSAAATERGRRRAEALRANLRRRKTGRTNVARQDPETAADSGREEI